MQVPTVQIQRRLFTVQEYEQMIRAGVFGEDDRLELIEGAVIAMSPIGPGHAATVKRLAELFYEQVREHAIVSVQDPVRLDEHSEPQPDLALLRRRDDYYATAHPRPEDVLLIVEVADTSVEFDQTVKLRLYARAGIPEVWILNLPEVNLEVYRGPTASGYKEKRTLGAGDTISPLALPDVTFAVSDILGTER